MNRLATGKTLMVALAAFLMTQAALAERTLEHNAIIDASVADVWTAFTTSEGFSSWAVAKAKIDLRVGGDIITSYQADSTLDDDSTIVNRILSFEPQRMLSIQNVRAPKGFKNANLFQQTWTVIYFEPIGSDRTQVRVIGLGYREGTEWDEIYNMFKAGNQWTLDKLRKKFAKADESPTFSDDEVLAKLAQLSGGEWIHETARPDGSIFRARHVLSIGPDRHSIVGKSWLGDADGMFMHGSLLIFREPARGASPNTGNVRFLNIDQNGDIATGGIRLISPDQLQWDWNAQSLNGTLVRYLVTMTFQDHDHYRFLLKLNDPTEGQRELVDIVYTRVPEAPPEFMKMKDLPTANERE